MQTDYCERKHAFCPDCRDKLPDNFCWRCHAQTLERQIVLMGERAVVDFDDSTVGMVDKAVPDGSKYKDWLREVLSADKRAKDLERQLAEAKNVIAELQDLAIWM